MSMRARLFFALWLAGAAGLSAGTVGRVDLSTLQTPSYTAEGDAFVRHNGDRFCNRPLYANQMAAVVLGGDKPLIKFGESKTLLGAFLVGYERNGHGKWLIDYSDITSRYRPGRMEWTVRDTDFDGVTINLTVVPTAQGAGFALKAEITGAQPGDKIIWADGAARQESASVLWVYDVTTIAQADRVYKSFVPADCRNNADTINGNSWRVQATAASARGTRGSCSVPTSMIIGDASRWQDPVALAASAADKLPIVCGTIDAGANPEIYWALESAPAEDGSQVDCAQVFAAGMQRVQEIENRVTVDTPDDWLNAAVGASTSVMDGVFRDGMYTHAGMRWGTPLLGWRTQTGGTVYGWHDRVLTEAKICLAKQITNSDKLTPVADVRDGLACQSTDSRLFGKGRINIYQPWHYDMQSQFFDQLVQAWRWTDDPALAKILQPGLELHLDYIRDCFDPEGSGLYESYANTWPTDDQWYNGGGTAEETAYAYNSEKAALKLAQSAGDTNATTVHQARLDHIRKAFIAGLWIPERGHVGAYREQMGLKRLHESSWLYSTFCPIDAGLLDAQQAAQALYYTEWGLERIQMPYGGEECWPSCWVPSIWSLREMWPGDDYQLALAYYQTGLRAEGWKLLHGTFPEQMFYGRVPGDLGHPAGATDFNDCAGPFCRTVVEGLFGYRPDYPDGWVTIAPQFPADWDHASIRTPDVQIKFQQQGNTAHYEVNLAKACAMNLELPVCTTKITGVTLNGQSVKWQAQAGFGQSLLQVRVPAGKTATVEVACADTTPLYAPVQQEAKTGDVITLKATDGKITQFNDPQGVLTNAVIAGGEITGTVTTNAGYHIVFALTQTGKTKQWREFKIKVTDPQADAAQAAKFVQAVPKSAKWNFVDMQSRFNGDVRTIFQQKYLSPRPDTCSLRIAENGYCTWQMMLEGSHPPVIDLTGVTPLLAGNNYIQTPQGARFAWPGGITNIAFTSQWDNWPHQVTVPVHQTGDAVWMLVCGSSNPMQVKIANAELRMKYSDGVVERLELIPPDNFWSLCPMDGCDYDYTRDGFCLPATPPPTVQLGNNCRAMVLNWKLRPGAALDSVTLETLSQEVVIGLMGVSVMKE